MKLCQTIENAEYAKQTLQRFNDPGSLKIHFKATRWECKDRGLAIF